MGRRVSAGLATKRSTDVIMPSRETVPSSPRPPRTARWLSGILTTVALLVLVLGAALVVVVIRRSPEPMVSPERDSTTSIATPTRSTESVGSASSADAGGRDGGADRVEGCVRSER
jgi:hypothetical protein